VDVTRIHIDELRMEEISLETDRAQVRARLRNALRERGLAESVASASAEMIVEELVRSVGA
jgi:Arc/MetJ family transcription regulator